MSVSIAKINNHEYVAGLDWEPVTTHAELKKEARTAGVGHAALVRGRGRRLLSAGLSNAGRGKTPSAAALFAQAIAADNKRWSNRAVLMVEECTVSNEKMFWMAAAKEGVVYPGTDIVASQEDMATLLSDGDYLVGDFEVVGRGSEIFTGRTPSAEFSTICPWTPSNNAQATIVSVSRSSGAEAQKNNIRLVVLLGVLAATLFFVFSGEPEEVRQDLREVQRTRTKLSEKALESALNRDAHFPSFAQFANEMSGVLDDLPVEYRGWSMSHFRCSASDNACYVNWKLNDQAGTPASLRERLAVKEVSQLQFFSSGVEAKAAIPFKPQRLAPKVIALAGWDAYEDVINKLRPYIGALFDAQVSEPKNSTIRGVVANNGVAYSIGRVSLRYNGWNWESFMKDSPVSDLLVSEVVVSPAGGNIQIQVEAHYVANPI